VFSVIQAPSSRGAPFSATSALGTGSGANARRAAPLRAGAEAVYHKEETQVTRKQENRT
jgi:hypothetical protein